MLAKLESRDKRVYKEEEREPELVQTGSMQEVRGRKWAARRHIYDFDHVRPGGRVSPGAPPRLRSRTGFSSSILS